MSISLWGPEFFVNTKLTDVQTFPAVAAFASGGFVSAWEDRGTTTDLRGQLFYANGVKHGVEFVINSTTANTQETPTIAILSDGRFVVAWVDNSGAGGEDGFGIRARVFNPDGSAVGPDFKINTTSLQDQIEVSISSLANGGFVVTYSDTDSTNYSHVLSRAFGSNLQPVALADSAVASDGGRVQGLSKVVGLEHGYATTFLELDPVTFDVTLRGRIFGDDGVGGAEFTIAAVNDGRPYEPSMTRLSDGRFAVVWTEEAADATRTIKARLYEANGTASGAAFTVNETALGTAGTDDRISVTALSEGGFAVAYTNPVSALTSDIHATLFYAQGQRIGVDTIISPADTEGFRSLSALAALADGRLIATWLDDSGNIDDPVGISGQILEIRTKAVVLPGTQAGDDFVGTEFNDVIGGGLGDDRLDGAAGNDTLDGGAGEDLLFGGAGNDVIRGGDGHNFLNGDDGNDTLQGADGKDSMDGGAGADSLFGGGGDDVLLGGDGNDTLDGGEGMDTMTGGDGDDTYIVRSFFDSAFEEERGGFDTAVVFEDAFLKESSTIEALTAASGAPVASLAGNDDDNRLTGNESANRLDGGKGNDTMIGGGGNDIFIVNERGDRVSDSSGYDKVIVGVNFTLEEGSGIEVVEADLTLFFETPTITGNSSANLLRGGYGSSNLRGMGGNDTLSSSLGIDTMTGGAGRDTFVFNTKVQSLLSSRDRITDFNPADDTIQLENSAFKKIGKGTSAKPGKLNKAFFKIGAKAGDGNDYVLYDRTKGLLLYDANGSGQGAAVKIATLPKKLKMSALDFFVI